MDQYAQWVKRLESQRKSVLETLKEYEPLKELLHKVEEDLKEAKSKIKALEGRAYSAQELLIPRADMPYEGLKIAEAAYKYLSNGAADRSMQGIAKALIKGGLSNSTPNSIQAIINKKKAPNGPFVKKGKDWFVKE